MRLSLLFTLCFILALSTLAKKDKTEIKFISYNIRYEGAPTDTGAINWSNRKQATIKMIKTEKPDVIGFQEARPTQTNYVIENLPQYGYIYAKMDLGQIPAGSSVLILYKKKTCELLDWGYFWLGEQPTKELKGWDAHNLRPTSWVKLCDKKSKKVFYYFNTHLDHKGKIARIKGVNLLIQKMREIAGEDAHLVIGGDMNSSTETAFDIDGNGKKQNVLKPFFEWMKGGRETAPITDNHFTFNGFNAEKVQYWLDHIFYRNGEALKFETLIKGYGAPYISDHYPIALTVKF